MLVIGGAAGKVGAALLAARGAHRAGAGLVTVASPCATAVDSRVLESMSAALPRDAREQIVSYYARYYGVDSRDAVSRHPFRYSAVPPSYGGMDADTAFRVLKANLDALGASVPMLYKQYTDLCEPGGARFLAFGVDPAFCDSIDGLIEVDLHRIRPKKRARYLQPSVEAVPA